MEYVYVVYKKNTQTNTKTIGFADQYSLNLIKVKKLDHLMLDPGHLIYIIYRFKQDAGDLATDKYLSI